MTQKNNLQVNYWRLLGIILIFSVILFVLLFLIVAYEESDQGYEIIYRISGVLFYIIAFPIALFAKINYLHSGGAFIWGAVAGIICWSVLMEIIFIRYSKKMDK
jgi:hypothetical protein